MRDAQAAAHRLGLTGIHDFDSTLALEAFQDLAARGELRLRVMKGIPHEQLSAAISLGLRSGFGDEWLTLGPVKMFADGALGPQTAWMIAPYEGTWSVGIPRLTEQQLYDDILRANEAGIACAVHAIGDAACHVVLDAFERAAAHRSTEARTGRRPLRNRIEHVQLLHPDDIGRLARAGDHRLHAAPARDLGHAHRRAVLGRRGAAAPMRGSRSWTRAPSSPSGPTAPWRSATRWPGSTPR